MLATLSTMAQTKLTVSMDSATLLMGRVTPYHIELLTPADARGQLLVPKDSMCANVEIAVVEPADTNRVENGRMVVRQTIMLQSFDSGMYLMNPVVYISGHDTILSERLALKVIPVPVDTLTTIHDYADVVDVNRKIIDFLPDWMADYGIWILGIILACAVIYYGFRMVMKKPQQQEKAIPLVPPYDEAVAALNALHEQKLCEQGREKDFYTRLTDILRNYLQRRFGINAMEMTSSQILARLENQEDTRLSKRYMNEVLKIADFVKFAKVRPMPDDNVQAYNSAIQFVEDTKPSETPAENDEQTQEPPSPPAAKS